MGVSLRYSVKDFVTLKKLYTHMEILGLNDDEIKDKFLDIAKSNYVFHQDKNRKYKKKKQEKEEI